VKNFGPLGSTHMCAVMSIIGLLPYWIGGECSISSHGTHTARFLCQKFGLEQNKPTLNQFFQTACKAFEEVGVKEQRVVEHILCDAERANNPHTGSVHRDILIANQNIYVRDGKYIKVISSKGVHKVTGSLYCQFPYMGKLCYMNSIAIKFSTANYTFSHFLKKCIFEEDIPEGLDNICEENKVFDWKK